MEGPSQGASLKCQTVTLSLRITVNSSLESRWCPIYREKTRLHAYAPVTSPHGLLTTLESSQTFASQPIDTIGAMFLQLNTAWANRREGRRAAVEGGKRTW